MTQEEHYTSTGQHDLSTSLPWVEKYRPASTNDLVGNNKNVNALSSWLKDWGKPKTKRAALIIGPAGSGKTSFAFATANDLGVFVVEINASDKRNKSVIEEKVKGATIFSSLTNYLDGTSTSYERVVLIDEVDGLHGNRDRGGAPTLSKIIKETSVPIIMTANNPNANPLSSLKRVSKVILFSSLSDKDIFSALTPIIQCEKVKITNDQLKTIITNSQGDLRAAINDLEAFHRSIDNSLLGALRNQQDELVDGFRKLYQSKTYEEAIKAFNDTSIEYRLLLQHSYDVVSNQAITTHERIEMFEALAQADLYLSRIYKRQNWKLLKHFFTFISAGIVLNKQSKVKQIRYISFPEYYQTMGRYKSLRANRDKASNLLAKKFHSSKYRFTNEILPYLKFIFKEEPSKGAEIAAWLDLSLDGLLTFLPERIVNEITPYFELAKEKVNASRINIKQADDSPFSDDQINQSIESPKTDSSSESEISASQEENDQDIGSKIKPVKNDKKDENDEKDENIEKNDEKDSQMTIDDFF
ncbi:MAG: replication factor C large subunit [Candidatus Kariarchaeaceae archaeon]